MKRAGFRGFFVELTHRFEEFLGWLQRFFSVLDQHHESHVLSPFFYCHYLYVELEGPKSTCREIILWRRVACRVLCGGRWLRWEQNRPVRKTGAARFRNPEFRAEPARAWPIPALLRGILPG